MRWIKSHKFISVILTVFIVSVLMLGLTMKFGNRLGFLNKVYMVIEKPMLSLGESITENVHGIFSYRDLLEENEQLKEENERLQNEVISLTLSADELQELNELSEVLGYEFVNPAENIVTSNIVSENSTNWTHTFSIDRGSESGIEVGDIVLSGRSMIGKISETGSGWSKVNTIFDESIKINFAVQGNASLTGILEGSKDETLTGFMLDENSDIADGDVIVTSGRGIYPEGIVIGKISKVGYDSNRQLKTVIIVSDVNLSTIEKVSVII